MHQGGDISSLATVQMPLTPGKNDWPDSFLNHHHEDNLLL